jgi:two-component system LytT family response regulator
MTQPATVLIVDDEPVARRGLRAVLSRMPSVGTILECATGVEAIASIGAHSPDLVLLDVQMPDLDGLGVIDRVGVAAMPPVVFVTAYDNFAIRAFDRAAVDYVVKPYTERRIQGAVERALRAGADRRATLTLARLLAAVSEARSEEPGPRPRLTGGYLQRILAVSGQRAVVIPVEEVLWVKADDYCATIITAAGRSVIRESLNELEARLDPRQFLRVHRSAIVKIDAIRAVERTKSGLRVALSDGTRVPVSRARGPQVVATLGGYR